MCAHFVKHFVSCLPRTIDELTYKTNHRIKRVYNDCLNPLIATLKPQSNGPLYSNTVIATLAVDGWTVTLGTARGGPGAAAPPSPLLAEPNVTARTSTSSVPTSYYSMWHYNYLCTLKG